jgi:hypothetical protein
MSLPKFHPKCIPTHFLSNSVQEFFRGKDSQFYWDTLVTFQNWPKYINNHMKGKNSSNVVTLFAPRFSATDKKRFRQKKVLFFSEGLAMEDVGIF